VSTLPETRSLKLSTRLTGSLRKKGQVIEVHSLDIAMHSTAVPDQVNITFLLTQKNPQNNKQSLLLQKTRNAYQIVLQAKRLGQADDQMMVVWVN
jgi:hypothetical protein